MRTISSAAQTKIQTKTGTEPILIVEVQWAPNGASMRKYADKDFQGAAGKIIRLGQFDSSKRLKGGQSTSLSLVLDDSDDDIRNLLEDNDVQKAEATIYQSFDGLTSGQKFILFKGSINSPFIWDEGTRTVTVTIISDVESREVGFSPESGLFEYVDPEIIGQPWPICFGEVIRVPAQRITPQIQATSLTRYKPITLDWLKILQEKVKKYARTLAEVGLSDNVLDITGIEIVILNDEYLGLLEEIAKTYREFTTVLEDMIIANPTHETNLNTYVQNIFAIETKAFQIEKINEFIVNLNEQIVILDGEILDLEEAKQTELDKTPFHNTDFIFEIDQQAEVLGFTRGGKLQVRAQLSSQGTIILAEAAALLVANTTIEDIITVFDLAVVDFYSNELFPQGAVDLTINKQRFTGTITGASFAIDGTVQVLDLEPINLAARQNNNPNELWIEDASDGTTPAIRNRFVLIAGNDDLLGHFQRRVIFITQQEGNRCFFSPIVYQNGEPIGDDPDTARATYTFKMFDEGDIIEAQASTYIKSQWHTLLVIPGAADPAPDFVTGLYQLMVADWSLELGDEIVHSTSSEQVFIANLYESKTVNEVMAWKEEDGKRILAPVPDSYYSVDLAFIIAGFITTAIKLKRPLKEYEGENWEDEIFVSLSSTLSANTSEVIEWIVETWTGFTVDASSFASVETSLTNFPSNFALLTKEDSISLIEDIAWQARCAVWVTNDIVFIKYLSIEPDTDLTITNTDIEVGSLALTLTDTEELVTILKGKWQPDYSLPENTIILRNNVPIYGVHEEEVDIFIYNEEELVQRTLTFWLIRKSNTWKKILLTGFLNLLELEIFDTVKLNLDTDWFSDSPVKTVVENIDYDNESQSIGLTLWLPIRSGFMDPYPFAWMSSAPGGLSYPTSDDPYAGGG